MKRSFVAAAVGAVLGASVAIGGAYAEDAGHSGRGGASGSGIVDPTSRERTTTSPWTEYDKSHREWEKSAGDAPGRYGSGTGDPQRGGFEPYHEAVPNGH